MKAFIWRIVYAAVCVFMFWWIFPLFLLVIGFHLPSDIQQLLKVAVACLAILYVLYPSQPPTPF